MLHKHLSDNQQIDIQNYLLADHQIDTEQIICQLIGKLSGHQQINTEQTYLLSGDQQMYTFYRNMLANQQIDAEYIYFSHCVCRCHTDTCY